MGFHTPASLHARCHRLAGGGTRHVSASDGSGGAVHRGAGVQADHAWPPVACSDAAARRRSHSLRPPVSDRVRKRGGAGRAREGARLVRQMSVDGQSRTNWAAIIGVFSRRFECPGRHAAVEGVATALLRAPPRASEKPIILSETGERRTKRTAAVLGRAYAARARGGDRKFASAGEERPSSLPMHARKNGRTRLRRSLTAPMVRPSDLAAAS